MASGAVGGLPSLTVVSAIAAVLLTFFFKRRKRDNPPAPPPVPAPPVSRDTVSDSDLSSAPAPAQGRSDEPSSSSPNSVRPGYDYEVFLSFRGPDTRQGFADFLYHSLVEAGIRTFMNNERLHMGGEETSSELLEAIKQSRVSIPILSRGYASSKWCLMELAKMVECMSTEEQKIIPVFYDVSPYEVRHQTGTYAEALSEHERSNKFSTEMIREWRDALAKVGALEGWDVSYGRYQGKAIRELVLEVLKQLEEPSHVVAESLVGIDDHIKKITRMLEIDVCDVKVVGICGMGGIGKTTIAKIIYNQLQYQFECCVFLSDIREASQSKGLEFLQRQLLSGVSSRRYGNFANTEAGKGVLICSLRDKKVLIVLDDADQTEQLNNLMGDLNWLGRGSRVIVTTRIVDVLCMSNVFTTALENNALVYEVEEMCRHNAFLLFCKHAFGQDFPLPDLASISLKIVEATGGLPLAIVSIGSYLSVQKKKGVWEEALRRLTTRTDILDKLKISYDALNREQREVFLDIVCLFAGMDCRIPVHLWKARGFSPKATIEDLQLRSMIRIGDNNELLVHDLYRELGRKIIRDESEGEIGKQSRLWCSEDSMQVLQNGKGMKNIEAIRLDYGIGSSQYAISVNELKHLPRFRFLDLADANLCGDPLGCLSELRELRWLGWHGTTRLNIPSCMYPENLLILDLSNSAVDETWDGWSPLVEAVNLEVLNLTNCNKLASTPRFSSFPHIEMLVLQECSALTVVDPSIGHLKNLKFLDLRKCQKLEVLPDEICFLVEMEDLLIDGCPIREIPISNGLKKLRTLSAKSCTLLTQIPQSIKFLVGLKELSLDNCRSLIELPTSVGELDSLEVLSLSHTGVASLPDSIGNSSHLRVLNIDHCPIRSFPHSVGLLGRLEVLNASWCLNLSGQIPFELGNLNLLTILRLDHTNITSIPRSIVGLTHLQTLDLEGCMKLQTLPDLPSSLVNLKVTCTGSEAVPNLNDLTNLQQFEILNCSNDLVQIQGRSNEPSSSSSIPIESGYEYEVFLSFRGPDTRTGFTDSLYHSLVAANIRTFRDDEELRLGEEISSELLEAIEQSRVFVAILSKGYASSKWCLKEVAKIVECNSTKKQKIIPIFYDVSPCQVRHQTGTYAKAFSMHEKSKNFSTEMIREWRDALAKVGALKGQDLTNDRHEGKAIRELVLEVHKQLRKPYLDVTHLVGIEDHMEKVMRLLGIDADDVKVVGICGMGGIGKTTIAKFIYYQLQDQFEYCSFLKDIREASKQSKGLESLQRQLVSDVSRCFDDNFTNTDSGKGGLVRSLCGKKVLILLDDVDHIKQLNNLVENLNWLGQGSRIIITVRKVDVLRMSNVFATAPKTNALVYDVEEMHPLNAFLLFCKSAFRQDFPLPNLASISWKIVQATGGLPLAIVAIGSHLSIQQKKAVWEEALRSLKTRKYVLDKLKISYDELSPEQREVFLDIVCLFAGMDRRIPVHVWKARGFSPETTIEDLQLRSLIRIGDNNELLVHDLYRELGREIIRDESKGNIGKQSRLWCSEDAIRVLQSGKGTENVKAINLDNGMQSEMCFFSSHKFKKLSNVWFLGLGNATLDGNFLGLLLELRWLSHHGFNLLNIPDGLNLENLVVLDLSRSSVSENWHGWNSLKDAKKLEVLNLSSCHQLTSTPNFPPLQRMKRLILFNCRGLAEVGPSIMELKALEFLDLRDCLSLVHLPEELGSLGALAELLLDGSSIRDIPLSKNMKNLEIISAKSCGSLTRLMRSIDLPLKLTKLILDNCESLTVLPDSIGQLMSLTDLSLSRTSTMIIPESIGHLSNLELLNVDYCPIGTLPQSLWKLERLEVLSASGCLNLHGEIPSEIGNLTSLTILCLDQTNVSRIPSTIKRLPCLRTLSLKECKRLGTIPNLPGSLVNLKVTCMSFDDIPNLLDLVRLRELEVFLRDEKAIVLKDIEKFSKIQKFSITIM